MDAKAKVKIVTAQFIGMYINNTLNGYGSEDFLDWLQDGEVFLSNDDFSKDDMAEIMSVADEIAPLVDKLTCKLDEIMNKD